MNGSPEVVVVPDASALAEEAASRFSGIAAAAVQAHGMFRVALSGGNTPRGLYERLAQPPYRDGVAWDRTQIFFSDERFVPHDSPDSNFYLAYNSLLSKVPIPERFVHRVATEETTPEEAAALYEEAIRRVFEAGLDEVPSFDLILLGMGDDGHTASLFPGTDALTVTDALVTPNYVAAKDMWRITFTYPLLNAASSVGFLIQGAEKASRVAQLFDPAQEIPAARVRPRGALRYILDRAAAAQIPGAARDASNPSTS